MLTSVDPSGCLFGIDGIPTVENHGSIPQPSAYLEISHTCIKAQSIFTNTLSFVNPLEYFTLSKDLDICLVEW